MEQHNRLFTKLEILKMARDIVNNEYIDIRGRMHNQWMVDSERVWLTEKRKLEYPKFPPFPSEEEIVKRARVFVDFLDEKLPDSNVDITTNHVCGSEHMGSSPTEKSVIIVDEVSIPKEHKDIYSKQELVIEEPVKVEEAEKTTLLGRYLRGNRKTN